MPISLPTSPALNDTYTYGSKTWKWDGTKWNTQPDYSNGITGPTGPNSPVLSKTISIPSGTFYSQTSNSILPGSYLIMKNVDSLTFSSIENYKSNKNLDFLTVSSTANLYTNNAQSRGFSVFQSSTSGSISNNIFYSYELPAVAYGSGKFVVIGGYSGTTATSTDGLLWSTGTPIHSEPYSFTFNKLIYDGGLFIAAGRKNSGNDRIYTSTNAITWTSRTIPIVYTVYAVGYGNGVYVIAGDYNTLSTSTDTITWTTRTSNFVNTSTQIKSYTYGGGLHVIGGDQSVSTSTNAITWTTRSTGFVTNQIRCLLYANSLFVAAGDGGTINTSTDTITWTARTSGFGTTGIKTLTYTNSLFVAAGASGYISTSADAVTWTARGIVPMRSGGTITSSASDGVSKHVVIGTYGGSYGSSTDGITWQYSQLGVSTNNGTTDTTEVVYGNSKYVTNQSANILNQSGVSSTVHSLKYSTDGIVWNDSSFYNTTPKINSIIYANSLFLAAASNGSVLTSSDGINWTTTTGVTPGQIEQIAYGNSTYMVLDNTGYLRTSTNAITWTSRTTSSSYSVIGFFNNKFYIRENSPRLIKSSTDGVTWVNVSTRITNGTAYTFLSNGTDIAMFLGDAGAFDITYNGGSTWTSINPLHYFSSTYSGAAYVNGIFIVTMYNWDSGYYLWSADGVIWYRSFLAGGGYIRGVSYANNKLFWVQAYTDGLSAPANSISVNDETISLIPYSASSIITAT